MELNGRIKLKINTNLNIYNNFEDILNKFSVATETKSRSFIKSNTEKELNIKKFLLRKSNGQHEDVNVNSENHEKNYNDKNIIIDKNQENESAGLKDHIIRVSEKV